MYVATHGPRLEAARASENSARALCYFGCAGHRNKRSIRAGCLSAELTPAAVAAKGKIFDIPLFEFIDAGETVAKNYAAFLFAVPEGYAGTEQVAHEDGQLVVRPRGTGGDRGRALDAADGAIDRTDADLAMAVDALFIE